MTTNELIEKIKTVNGVTGCNVWEKGENSRLYIEFKSQNRFAAVITNAPYVDLKTGKLVAAFSKKECAGAATYELAKAGCKEIEKFLAE